MEYVTKEHTTKVEDRKNVERGNVGNTVVAGRHKMARSQGAAFATTWVQGMQLWYLGVLGQLESLVGVFGQGAGCKARVESWRHPRPAAVRYHPGGHAARTWVKIGSVDIGSPHVYPAPFKGILKQGPSKDAFGPA